MTVMCICLAWLYTCCNFQAGMHLHKCQWGAADTIAAMMLLWVDSQFRWLVLVVHALQLPDMTGPQADVKRVLVITSQHWVQELTIIRRHKHWLHLCYKQQTCKHQCRPQSDAQSLAGVHRNCSSLNKSQGSGM